jgi:hypothetical protein
VGEFSKKEELMTQRLSNFEQSSSGRIPRSLLAGLVICMLPIAPLWAADCVVPSSIVVSGVGQSRQR